MSEQKKQQQSYGSGRIFRPGLIATADVVRPIESPEIEVQHRGEVSW